MQKIKTVINIVMVVSSIVSGVCGIVMKSSELASEIKRK